MIWIKICGNTNIEDAAVAVEAGADALGFIFASSPRRIDAATAREIVQTLPASVEKVGVFVDEPVSQVVEVVQHASLTAVQLHGDEDAAYLRSLRSEFRQDGATVQILKALAVSEGFAEVVREYLCEGCIDGLLLDSPPAANGDPRGGTGRTFDWKRVAGYVSGVSEDVRIIVGGGLSPGNVAGALQQLRPWGVDVCSGVELQPGRKDPAKVQAFVHAVRTAETSS